MVLLKTNVFVEIVVGEIVAKSPCRTPHAGFYIYDNVCVNECVCIYIYIYIYIRERDCVTHDIIITHSYDSISLVIIKCRTPAAPPAPQGKHGGGLL